MLRYGVKFYVSIMAAALIFRADVLIVNRFRGAAEAGVYAVASQFSFLLLMLPGVIATLLFPRVASSAERPANSPPADAAYDDDNVNSLHRRRGHVVRAAADLWRAVR